MKTQGTNMLLQNKDIAGVILGTGLVLTIPFVAMQFTNEVNWDITDFLVIAILLMGMGLTYVFLARKIRNSTQRALLAIGILAITLYIWAELAVGIFTNWGS